MSRTAFFKDMPPYAKLLVSVGFVLLSLIIFTVISLVLSILVFPVKLDHLLDPLHNIKEQGVLQALNLMQLLSGIGTFIIPSFLLAYLMSENSFSFLKLNNKTAINSLILVVIMVFAMMPFINWMVEMNGKMVLPHFLHGLEEWMKKSESESAELTKYFLNVHSTQALLFNVFMIALIPAIGEELLFRGVLQRLFVEWTKNKHAAIFITAALFSALHMQFYGFFPRMLLGVLFGYLLIWSGSLWLPICGHFINNASAVVLAYLYQTEATSIDPDKLGTDSQQWFLTLGSFVIMVGIMFLIHKIEMNRPHILAEDTIDSDNQTLPL